MRLISTTTLNIQLRELKPSDVTDDYVDWMNNPRIVKYTESRFVHHCKENIKRWVEQQNSDPLIYLRGIFVNGEHVGNIKVGPINWIHQKADIGIIIGVPKYHSNGVATKVIGEIVDTFFGFSIDLHRLSAGCCVENAQACKAFLKNGFEIEGVRKGDYLKRNGDFADIVLFGLVNHRHRELYQHLGEGGENVVCTCREKNKWI